MLRQALLLLVAQILHPCVIVRDSCCLIFRPDQISPLDDLAFDMYQDPEVALLIRKLDAKKQKAAQGW